MNRSILIVICDFLLVSLLAFSTVDLNKVSDEGTPKQPTLTILTNAPEAGKDLAVVMRQALDEERKTRDFLMGELSRTRDAVTHQQALLGERDRQVQAFEEQLQSREQESVRLQQQRAALEQQYASAQTNLSALKGQLTATSTEALISREKAAAIEAEMRQRVEESAALQNRLASLEKSNQIVLEERQKLSTQLQVAEAEKRSAAELAARMQEQVAAEREERARVTRQAETLAQGVKTLASNSTELAQEIRENRALAPNTVFAEFVANRVEARFQGTCPGALGADARRTKTAQTVLVSNGTNTFALCHIEDTPFELWSPGVNWSALSGTLLGPVAQYVAVRSVSFHQRDPRVVLMPVTEPDVHTLGAKVYRTSADPYKFQDAVLVGAREGYYGECRFQIDLAVPGYVRLDRSLLRGLFGKFNPSRGDLVLSRTGELLGLMVNNTYCMMLTDWQPAATFQFGENIRAQQTGRTLAAFYSLIATMPSKLR